MGIVPGSPGYGWMYCFSKGIDLLVSQSQVCMDGCLYGCMYGMNVESIDIELKSHSTIDY